MSTPKEVSFRLRTLALEMDEVSSLIRQLPEPMASDVAQWRADQMAGAARTAREWANAIEELKGE